MRTTPFTANQLAWLGLALSPGLPAGTARALVARAGSATALLDGTADVPAEVVAVLAGARERGRAEARRVAEAGAWVLVPGEPGFPARLAAIPDPPLVLVGRGTLAPQDDVAVAVVGARRASEYGRRLATDIATGLAQAGVTVVSGLATGIDAAAHRAAIAAGGRTVAVLGTGIDRVYPPWHRELADAVAAHGALLTELPCGAPPLAHHFPKRNRLISGLALGTVVVEAAEESGSLITAKLALDQGREVFAVPGPVGPAGHRGPHRLIREGARLVTRAEDVLEEIAPQLAGLPAARRAAATAATLTADERRVLEALAAGGHVDDVTRRTALAPAAALETLLALELRGLVEQIPGMRFRRAA
jgi:DNA processing protein